MRVGSSQGWGDQIGKPEAMVARAQQLHPKLRSWGMSPGGVTTLSLLLSFLHSPKNSGYQERTCDRPALYPCPCLRKPGVQWRWTVPLETTPAPPTRRGRNRENSSASSIRSGLWGEKRSHLCPTVSFECSVASRLERQDTAGSLYRKGRSLGPSLKPLNSS